MTEEGSIAQRGVCIWLTGLSGSGKSTTATVLAQRLAAIGCRVRVLDGDVVRAQRATRLGFSRADREANALSVAQAAGEAMALGEIAICALISPYRDTRDHVRAMMGPASFIEVFMDTPLALCEARDVKGLYRRARTGALRGVTGIDDPYEPPVSPDVRLTTATTTPEENVDT
ncbi:MAG TPA: adenylyl-sulfate kinase, partial [Vicinamibacterales bacterium]|nr:adenylyl-sulfate kinase [Vicinamibacterales bacterium]